MNINNLTQNLLQLTLLSGCLSLPLAMAENTTVVVTPIPLTTSDTGATAKPTSTTANSSVKSTAKSTKTTAGLSAQLKTGATVHQGKIPFAQTKIQLKSSPASASYNNGQHDVWFHSLDITLLEDPNHNGYYNRLIVDFDLDTYYDHSEVYAVMSLTDPNGLTTDYFVTNSFDIYAESSTDDYHVDTVLTDNWPADGYDLSIHVYDSYDNSLVAYIDKYDEPQLGYLTLESLDHEYWEPQYLSVFSSSLLLKHDDDGDGYYHNFTIDLDVDINYGSKDVYAEIYISNDNYHWEHLYTSDSYQIEDNSIIDRRKWDIDLVSGHPSEHYFIKVELYDSYDDYLVMEILPQDNAAFYAIPLEDQSHEQSPTPQPTPQPPANNDDRHSVSSEGGGSFGSGLILTILSLISLGRRSAKFCVKLK